MYRPVLGYEIDIRAAGASEENVMPCRCLQARKIHGHVHNTITDFVTMICEVKNTNYPTSSYRRQLITRACLASKAWCQQCWKHTDCLMTKGRCATTPSGTNIRPTRCDTSPVP